MQATKKLFLATLLLSNCGLAYAAYTNPALQAPPVVKPGVQETAPDGSYTAMTQFNAPNGVETAAPINSNAIAFAKQAGAIAGVAQACGIDITVFSSRTAEAINKMASSPPDKVLAMQTFQQAAQISQQKQIAKRIVPCEQAQKDFNDLPILRDNYQQTVIAQLSSGAGAMAPVNPPAYPVNAGYPVNVPPPATPNNQTNQPGVIQGAPQGQLIAPIPPGNAANMPNATPQPPAPVQSYVPANK